MIINSSYLEVITNFISQLTPNPMLKLQSREIFGV